MMDVKVEVGDQVPAYADVEARTQIPTLDDVMNADELEQITLEGLAANPEQTEAELKASLEKAQQQEAYINYLKQQQFFQFMNRRPIPVTARQVDWGLFKYLCIVAEKEEFDHQPEIKALHESQWYHGILSGNIAVFRKDDGEVNVALKQPYIGLSTNVQMTPAQIAMQKVQQQKAMPRKQRRVVERAQ